MNQENSSDFNIIRSSMVCIINCLLEKTKQSEDFKEIIRSQRNLSFNLTFLPSQSIRSFINLILDQFETEESTLVLTVILLDRYLLKGISLTALNCYYLFFISFLISSKINEESIYDENLYCKISGLPKERLKRLEMEFLENINFDLNFTSEDYLNYKGFLFSLVTKSHSA